MVRIFQDNESCNTELATLPAGTVVVCPDSQERCGKGSWLVFEVVDDPQESVLQRGLFWHRDNAEIFAEAYDNATFGMHDAILGLIKECQDGALTEHDAVAQIAAALGAG